MEDGGCFGRHVRGWHRPDRKIVVHVLVSKQRVLKAESIKSGWVTITAVLGTGLVRPVRW